MTIQTVKIQGEGWLVNGTMTVPNDPANRHCQMVHAWIAEANTPSPEFTNVEIAANTQAETNATNQAYLDDTDKFFTRFSETGVAMPEGMTEARADARASIV